MKKNFYYFMLICVLIIPLKTYNAVSLSDFFNLLKREKLSEIIKPKVAVISLQGSLESAKSIIRQLMIIKKDPTIKGLILHMNCWGSNAGTGEAIFNEILKFKQIKPVVVVVENFCLSGGYLIASGANHIIALASSEIGSIGVKCEFEKRKDLTFTDNNLSGSTEMIIVKAGDYKALYNPYTPLGDEDIKILTDHAQKFYDIFIKNIANTKGLALEDEKIWANGKTFSGIEALELGLIDQLGGFSDGFEKMIALLAQKGIILGEDFEIVDIKI